MDISTNQIDLKNSIINKSTILYVEDEDILRTEISSLLEEFFEKVIVASNGEEALVLYEKSQSKIDILITDINMPKMNGIELVSRIRQINQELPVIVCTAFNDSEILIKAIKLDVSDYIIKPIQMMTTLNICDKLLTNKRNELLVKKQLKELEDLKSVLEDENFIIETNLNGEIIYVNDLISEASGYSKEELIGSRNSILKHPDTSKDFIKNLWETINNGDKWHGKIKYLCKDKNTFYVKTTIIPIFDEQKNIVKFLSTGFLITAEEEEKQNLKRLILQQKGEKLKVDSEIQKRVNEEVQKTLNNSQHQSSQENEKLVSLVNEMDDEIKRLRHKNMDSGSRTLTMEKKFKEYQGRFDNMQIAYQKKVAGLHTTAQTLARSYEDILKKNKTYTEKLEKAYLSIKTLQGYIEEYRKKIDDLEDVIKSYEKDIKDAKSYKY